LTSKLLGWKVDIQKDESQVSFEEKVARAVANLASVEGVSEEDARTLVASGFLTVEGILAAEVDDIAETTGLDRGKAGEIQASAAAHGERAQNAGEAS
jgi:hypothetical protein